MFSLWRLLLFYWCCSFNLKYWAKDTSHAPFKINVVPCLSLHGEGEINSSNLGLSSFILLGTFDPTKQVKKTNKKPGSCMFERPVYTDNIEAVSLFYHGPELPNNINI